eukprot:2205106-Rhodomonas_salina.1
MNANSETRTVRPGTHTDSETWASYQRTAARRERERGRAAGKESGREGGREGDEWRRGKGNDNA